MICSMQVHLSKQMPSVWDGYLDPQCIAQTNFTYAKAWELDGKELAVGETIEEKEIIWKKEIREASLKVAAYISLALKHLQYNSSIWLPYNFE
jgi:hypothetical protein